MPEFKTGEDFYNKIYLHFNVLIAISLVPFGIMLLDIQSNKGKTPIVDGIASYLIVSAIITVGGWYIYKAYQEYKMNFSKISKDMLLREKLNAYYKYNIKKYIIIAIVCVVVVVGLILTRQKVLIPAYVVTLVFLSIGRPTLREMIRQLGLNDQEESILYKKEEIP